MPQATEVGSTNQNQIMTTENKSCSTGGCGSKGLCPGIALLPSYLVGLGITTISNSTVLGFLVGIPVFFLLVNGVPRIKKTAKRE